MSHTVRRFLRQPWLRELLLVALLFKALIPIGYMPNVGSDGLPTLKLCSAFAISVGADIPAGHGDDSDDATNSAAHSLCPHALQVQPALAQPVAHVTLPAALSLQSWRGDFGTPTLYRSPTPHSRLPRGPPASV